jgi:hypothetical protein
MKSSKVDVVLLVGKGSSAVCMYTKGMRQLIDVSRDKSFDLISVSMLTTLAAETGPWTDDHVRTRLKV